MKILVPYISKYHDDETDEDRRVLRGFGVGTVFDISQTDGEEIDRVLPVLLTSDSSQEIYTKLAEFSATKNITIEIGPTLPANGYYMHPSLIKLGEHIQGDQRTKTLAHELAHALTNLSEISDRDDRETIAESAAFVVLHSMGVDTSTYTFPYVTHWAKNKDTLKTNMETIRKISHEMIEAIQ